MQISRRDALMGAGAAAVVAGVPGAVGASDPAIDLAEQLNTAGRSPCWSQVLRGSQSPPRGWHRAGMAGERMLESPLLGFARAAPRYSGDHDPRRACQTARVLS